ncbi:probable G-protein coupled receptor 75 [Gigantopelta aegis]|uniref:probable G-protein coupled receptor 75 n=1 Tax=Gigantopelta aegis TaxID=1735272 RepID=UPI001B888698|nr:probable G-protein coupled receptor 75 [Gigantopelta aegis]
MDSLIVRTSSPVMEPVFQGTVHTASLAVCTVLVLFVVILGSFGNGIVILSAVKCKRMRSNFDLLIVNLAGTDFILCTCLSPVFLYLLFTDPPTPKLFCGSFLFLGTACGMLSLLTIVTIALHRQARVVGKAKGSLTPTKTALILATIWLMSLGTALGGTLHVTSNWDDSFQNCQVIINSPNLRTHNFVLFFVCPVVTIGCAIIAVSYTIIGRAVRNQTKALRVTTVTTSIYKGPRTKVPPDQKLLPETKPREKMRRIVYSGRQCPCCCGQAVLDKENKAITMCLVVIFTILLCWTPLVISQFVELVTGESIILYQVKLCGIALVFLNSALDPYIYGQHNGRIKKKYRRLLWDFIRCHCKSVTKARLRLTATGNQQTAKQKSNSQNDQDTRTLNLASPKQAQKFVDKGIGPGNIPTQRTYTSNILLYQNSRDPAAKIPCGVGGDGGGGAPVRKGGSQVGDIQAMMHDVKSFVHKSCCHTGIPEDQSLIYS